MTEIEAKITSEILMQNDEAENNESEESEENEETNESYGRYYTNYINYTSPNGILYIKHNAIVPHEYLIEYIKCMNYQKFERKNILIELDKQRENAKITRYVKTWQKISKHYFDDANVFYAEIYTLLISATSEKPVKCYRPSYLYTADSIYAGDYMDEESMEDIKYSGEGVAEVRYNGYSFRE